MNDNGRNDFDSFAEGSDAGSLPSYGATRSR